jgi:hypothetical protein
MMAAVLQAMIALSLAAALCGCRDERPPRISDPPPSLPPAVARIDAGTAPVPAVRDDCTAEDLQSGRCRCAHRTCMDTCCPDGYVCAHGAGPGAGAAKCLRPPRR